jgi:hypothetical protein
MREADLVRGHARGGDPDPDDLADRLGNGAVVRVTDGGLEAVAGGFDVNVHLPAQVCIL